MNINRQAGRRRGRGGQRQGGGGNPNGNNGNRIDNRARGNANQLYEKYKTLAAEAQRQGDRVNTEYYLQFADHYFRVLAENRNRFEEQNPNQNQQRRGREDAFDDEDEGYEDDGAEGETRSHAARFRPSRAGRVATAMIVAIATTAATVRIAAIANRARIGATAITAMSMPMLAPTATSTAMPRTTPTT